jgi:hypothetical protein
MQNLISSFKLACFHLNFSQASILLQFSQSNQAVIKRELAEVTACAKLMLRVRRKKEQSIWNFKQINRYYYQIVSKKAKS